MTRFMYVFCLLVWGLNFIAVKIQGTPVGLDVSLAYRLAGAALLFIALAAVRSVPLKIDRVDIPCVVVFGLCNFAISYLLLYYATIISTAALVTLVFSMKTVMTPVALRVFLGDALDRRILVGGGVSLTGVAVLLYPSLSIDASQFMGCGLAVLGTAITAVGDAASARNARRNVNLIAANCTGFVAAAVFMFGICLLQGRSFDLPIEASYLGALMHLTVFASFFAWLFYLTLVGRIGAARSGYIVCLFPAVGGVASVILGESDLSAFLVVGCLLSCLGAAYSLSGFVLRPPFMAKP